jgi:hypothetical protein
VFTPAQLTAEVGLGVRLDVLGQVGGGEVVDEHLGLLGTLAYEEFSAQDAAS